MGEGGDQQRGQLALMAVLPGAQESDSDAWENSGIPPR